MSNIAAPQREIHYISELKKIFIGRNQNTLYPEQMFKIDSEIDDFYYFQIINRENKIVDLHNRSFEIYLSYIDAKQKQHILAHNSSYAIEDNKLIFQINTYTNTYLDYITTDPKIINITIVETTLPITQVVLRDKALAYPRPNIGGNIQQIVEYEILTGITVPITGAFGCGEDLSLIPNVNSFAFGEGLITQSENQLVVGSYNIPDGEQVFIVGNGTDNNNRSNIFTVNVLGEAYLSGARILTQYDRINVSQLVNDIGYITGDDISTYTYKAGTGLALDEETLTFSLTAAIPTTVAELSDASDYALASSVTALGEDIQTVSAAIPTKTSQLTNDSNYATVNQIPTGNAQLANTCGFITSYVDTTYTAGTGLKLTGTEFSLTASIPTKTSQLTNDANFATVSQIPTNNNQLVNGAGYITSYVDTTYTAGTGINISEDNVISVTNEGSAATQQYVDDAVSGLSATVSTAYATKAEIPTVPTNVGAFTNDVGYLTAVPEGYATESYVTGKINNLSAVISTNYATTGDLNAYTKTTDLGTYISTNILTAYATTGWVEEKGYATTGDLNTASTTLNNSITGKADLSTLETVSGELNSAITARALETDLQIVSAAIPTAYVEPSEIEDMATTGYVTGYCSSFITAEDIPEGTVYLAGEGLALDGATFSLTGTILTGGTNIEVVGKSINFTGDIPTAISDLTNDSQFATSAQVSSIVEDMSAAIVDGYATQSWVNDKNYISAIGLYVNGDYEYVTSFDVGDHLSYEGGVLDGKGLTVSYNETDTENVYTLTIGNGLVYQSDQLYLDTNVVSAVVTGYGYETAANVATLCTALSTAITGKADSSAISTYVAGTNVSITSSDINQYIISATDTTYSAGSGLELDGTTFKLTAAIPSIEGLATENDLQAVSAVVSTLPTENTTYTAGSGLKLEGTEFSLTASIPTVATLSADMYTAISGDVDSLITSKNYITGIANNALLSDIKTYTAGEGLKLDGTEFSLTATIPTVATLSAGMYEATSASIEDQITGKGYVTTDTTYTAGTGLKLDGTEFSLTATIPELSSVYGLLSGVNVDITQDNQTGVITLSAAGGGGGATATNKQVLSTVNGNQITYDSTVDIFKTTYTGSTLTLNTVTVPANSLNAGEVATFEEWISLNNDIPSASFDKGSNVLVGEIPSALLSSKTNVFTRRLVNNGGTITYYVSFAYEF